jgi:hypothetical protein
MGGSINMKEPWYRSSYRRNLIDMHIPDDDIRFMADFDAARYVELLKTARVDTAMVYASSCLGLCYWPTPRGRMHAGLGEIDLIGEVTAACREAGIRTVVYMNYWNKWAYDNHPDWRFVSADGLNTAEYLWDRGRFGVCCFNTPYGEHLRSQIEDLCRNYSFDGLWIDMIHWPYSPCHCGACKARYMAETQREIPRTVDWSDPDWVAWQRTRESWLADYAGSLTELAKRVKPGATVGQQSSSWSVGWQNGLTEAFFRHTDYCSGDFYGDALLQTFTCKALDNLSENRPFEFMTSRCPDLTEHTTTKSKALLRAQTFSAILNGGAFLFIDAIDPTGTLDERVYETMGEIYGELEAYEPYLNPDAVPIADVALYFNFESLYDPADNGKPVLDGSMDKPLMKAAKNAARTLMNANIPYTVITRRNLGELDRFAVVVLCDLPVADDEEIEAFAAYVHGGGGLYASGAGTLRRKDGTLRPDFGLAAVLGVSDEGQTEEPITYMAPAPAFEHWMPRNDSAHPMMIAGPQRFVRVTTGEIAATLTLAYTNPKDPSRFASAISNPPGIATERPSLVLNEYGAGRAAYCAGGLEQMTSDDHRQLFTQVLRRLANRAWTASSDAPRPVEAVWYRGGDSNSHTLRVLNYQESLPNIPVRNIEFRLKWEESAGARVLLLPGGERLTSSYRDGELVFTLPELETFAMVAIGEENMLEEESAS